MYILTKSLPQIHPNLTILWKVCILYKFCQLCWQLLPIMLALCSMLLLSYYAQNYADIITSSLAYLIAYINFLYLHRTCLYLHTFGHLEVYKFWKYIWSMSSNIFFIHAAILLLLGVWRERICIYWLFLPARMHMIPIKWCWIYLPACNCSDHHSICCKQVQFCLTTL